MLLLEVHPARTKARYIFHTRNLCLIQASLPSPIRIRNTIVDDPDKQKAVLPDQSREREFPLEASSNSPVEESPLAATQSR
jgi:hypothetical protein